MRMGDLLVSAHLVTVEDVAAALARQAENGARLGDNLVALGAIDKHTLNAFLRRIPVEPADITATGIDALDLLSLLMKLIYTGHLETSRQYAALGDIGIGLGLSQALGGLHGQNCAGGRCLAVIDVTDRAYVDVRFLTFKSVFGHSSSLPKVDCLGQILNWFFILPMSTKLVRPAPSDPHETFRIQRELPGAAEGIRTLDLVLTKDALYQLSYSSPSFPKAIRPLGAHHSPHNSTTDNSPVAPSIARSTVTHQKHWPPRSLRRTDKRVKGIEPSSLAWKAMALPLSYTRAQFPVFHSAGAGITYCYPETLLFSAAPHSIRGLDPMYVLQWGVQDSNLRRQSHQIYSLTPLTARETPLTQHTGYAAA